MDRISSITQEVWVPPSKYDIYLAGKI